MNIPEVRISAMRLAALYAAAACVAVADPIQLSLRSDDASIVFGLEPDGSGSGDAGPVVAISRSADDDRLLGVSATLRADEFACGASGITPRPQLCDETSQLRSRAETLDGQVQAESTRVGTLESQVQAENSELRARVDTLESQMQSVLAFLSDKIPPPPGAPPPPAMPPPSSPPVTTGIFPESDYLGTTRRDTCQPGATPGIDGKCPYFQKAQSNCPHHGSCTDCVGRQYSNSFSFTYTGAADSAFYLVACPTYGSPMFVGDTGCAHAGGAQIQLSILKDSGGDYSQFLAGPGGRTVQSSGDVITIDYPDGIAGEHDWVFTVKSTNVHPIPYCFGIMATNAPP